MKDPKIEITNECNMKLMARYPDNTLIWLLLDPPYKEETTGLSAG